MLTETQPILLNKLKSLSEEQQKRFCDLFQPFIANILDLMIKYLPLENEIIDSLDFGHSISNFGELLEKILKFNSYFGIIGETDISELIEEIKTLSSRKASFYTENTNNLLEVWTNIEKDQNFNFEFKLLPLIFRAAQSLPITSSNVERAFSGIKLVKTLIRNKLSDLRLSSIYMIIEQYQDTKMFNINQEVLNLYEQVKSEFRIQKHKRKAKEISGKEIEERKEEDKFQENLEEANSIEEEYKIWDNMESLERKVRTLTKNGFLKGTTAL